MAIIDCLDGITASIVIDGRKAFEHPPWDIPHNENTVPTKTCYVESEAGQTFHVEITVNQGRELSRRNGLLFRVLVDGKQVDSVVLHRPLTKTLTYKAIGPLDTSCVPGQSVRRLLTFAPVVIVEDASSKAIESHCQIAKLLGTIQVMVSTCSIGKRRPPRHSTTSRNPQNWVLHEKALKGRSIALGAVFSSSKQVPHQPWRRRARGEVPRAEFRFCYRTHEALQDELIIPRTRPADSRSVVDELDSLSSEEIRRLAAQMLCQNRKGEKIKQGNCPESYAGGPVFTEDTDISAFGYLNVQSKAEPFVVDLTGDSSLLLSIQDMYKENSAKGGTVLSA